MRAYKMGKDPMLNKEFTRLWKGNLSVSRDAYLKNMKTKGREMPRSLQRI